MLSLSVISVGISALYIAIFDELIHRLECLGITYHAGYRCNNALGRRLL